MSNVIAKIEKKDDIEVLTVTLPISKRPSASGKTMIIASTNGNQPLSITIDGKRVILGLNAYIK